MGAEYVGAYSVGSALRAAREARGEALTDIAHVLKLSSRQIEAMEMDRFDLLPGPAFVRGFLRNYARYLGVDAEAMLEALSHDVAQQKVELAPVTNASGAMPDGNGEQRMLKPAAIIIWGLLLALGMGWYFDWFKVAETPPVVSRSEIGPLHDAPMPPELLADRPGVQESVSQTLVGQIRAVPADAEPPREVVVAPLPAVAPAPVVAAAMPSAVTVERATAAAPAQVTEPAPAAPAAPMAAVEDAVPAGLGRLVFKLDGESWIQVRDSDDVTLFSGVAAAGTTRTVQGKPPFSLVIGNAAKVVLEHDGKPVDLAPHIRSGGVARVKLEQTGR
ncbi:MAG: helix-turn-helix domain-containing protein [Rhodocyclales bacterium]|nr:helix-turn-helix domain-containing protein [Rhodocyclales bacterium]